MEDTSDKLLRELEGVGCVRRGGNSRARSSGRRWGCSRAAAGHWARLPGSGGIAASRLRAWRDAGANLAAGPALKRRLAAHAYCAMPLPNDQFSFGTSRRFTKMFSGLMPGFFGQKLGDAGVERFFLSGPRVLLTVI
jgi:hypothetical protein